MSIFTLFQFVRFILKTCVAACSSKIAGTRDQARLVLPSSKGSNSPHHCHSRNTCILLFIYETFIKANRIICSRKSCDASQMSLVTPSSIDCLNRSIPINFSFLLLSPTVLPLPLSINLSPLKDQPNAPLRVFTNRT